MWFIAFPILAVVDCLSFLGTFIQHNAVFLFTLPVRVSEESFFEIVFFVAIHHTAKRFHSPIKVDSDDSSSLTGRTAGDSSMHRCEKCQGTMLLDREVDMESGMSLLVLWCINCGLRKQAERAPIPLIEVS